jgi:membrane protein involved in colicin uptake
MPAYVAMERFFAIQQQCIDGRFKMYSANTVAKRLQEDLKKTQHPMETTGDLHKLRGVAEDRKVWQEEIVKRIEQKEAAEDIRLAAKEKERIEARKRKNNTAGTSVRQNDRRQRKRMRQDHLITTHPTRENTLVINRPLLNQVHQERLVITIPTALTT